MIIAENLTEEQLEEMAEEFDSVAVCDEVCLTLFIKNKWALHKTVEWAKSDNPLIKRAAFMIMAGLAREDKEAKNFIFRVFLPILVRESYDERAEVWQAILFALIEIAKRDEALYKSVQEISLELPSNILQPLSESMLCFKNL
jgi:3-methyladenine DNA glycosylase AlkD